MSTLIGLSVFVLAFGGMLWRKAYRWRYLHRSYGADPDYANDERTMHNAVLVGLGGYNKLMAAVTIGVHRTGVSFDMNSLFYPFHNPIFVPYEHIRASAADWYINGESTEFKFRDAPDVSMILPAEQAEWIRKRSGEKMPRIEAAPLRGSSVPAWSVFARVNAFISLAMMAVLIVVLIRA